MDRVEMHIDNHFQELIKRSGPIYEFIIVWMWPCDWLTFVHYDRAGNFIDDIINESGITSYPINNNHISLNERLDRFPILQKILDVLRLDIR